MNMVEIKKGISSKIIVTFPYNPIYVEKVKTIKEYRWHPENKHWSFPEKRGILNEIVETFKEEKIYIDPALQSLTTQNSQMLEGGTDLCYIQEFLGHKSSKTTEVYTYVSKRVIGCIQSPLDKIIIGKNLKEGGEK